MSIISKIHNWVKQAAKTEQNDRVYAGPLRKVYPFVNTSVFAGTGTLALYGAKFATTKLAKAGLAGVGISLFVLGTDYAIQSYKEYKEARKNGIA